MNTSLPIKIKQFVKVLPNLLSNPFCASGPLALTFLSHELYKVNPGVYLPPRHLLVCISRNVYGQFITNDSIFFLFTLLICSLCILALSNPSGLCVGCCGTMTSFHLEHGQWWILAKFPFLLKNGFWVEGCVQNYFSFHTWILKKCLLLEKGRMHVEERNRVYQNICTIFTLVKRDNNQNLLILTIALTQSRYESFIMYIMSIFKSIFPSQTSFKMV